MSRARAVPSPASLAAPLAAPRPEPVAQRTTSPVWVFLAPLLLALAIYYPTLGSSWAYDDVDYINQAADAMAGKVGFWEVLLRPQGEHIVAGFRLALFATLSVFGISALPLRLAVLVAHATSAALLGLLARRYGGSTAAGLVAALVYVGACGLSSMWIWFPSGSTVPFAMVALTSAMLVLACRDRLGTRRARWIAVAAVVLALLTESTMVPLVALPAAIDELERRRAGAGRWSIGAFTLGLLLAGGAIGALAATMYSKTFGPSVSLDVVEGVPRAAFLLLVAPFRLFFPAIPVLAGHEGVRTGILGSLLGIAVAAPCFALLLALWRRGAPRLAGVAAACLVGPAGWLLLVGLGRSRSSYWELYLADRYFFPLLVPLALLCAAVATSLAPHLTSWTRQQRWALGALLLTFVGAELALHRRGAIQRIPFDVYAAHEARFAQLERLADRLEEAALALPEGEAPLQVPDTDLQFADLHNGRLSTRVLLHVMSDRAGGRLQLGGPEVSERDAAILTPLLGHWSVEVGEPPPYRGIVQGRLVDPRLVTHVDFATASFDDRVGGGFSGWEGAHRWMGADGEVNLRLVSSVLTFDLALPEQAAAIVPGQKIRLDVTASDTGLDLVVPLGHLDVLPGRRTYTLDAAPFIQRIGAGREVKLLLRADHTWKPTEAFPGVIDDRDLSVMFHAVAVVPPA
jgi:hypothetical protein